MICQSSFSGSIPGLEEILNEPKPQRLQVLPSKCSFDFDPKRAHQTEIRYDVRRILTAKVCLTELIDLHFLVSLFYLPEDAQNLENLRELLPSRISKVYANQKFELSVVCALAISRPFCEIQAKELVYDGLKYDPRFQNLSFDFFLPRKNNFMNTKYDLDQELTGDDLWIKIKKVDDTSFSSVQFVIQE